MTKLGIATVAAWLVATTAFAQPLPKGPAPQEMPPLSPAPMRLPEPAAVSVEAPVSLPSETIWFRTDLLMLNISSPRSSLPIVTTGNPTDNCAGSIGQPGTRILFGGDDLANQNAGALRFVFGAWLDNAHTIGAEATGFSVFSQTRNFQKASDSTGNPPLYLSGFNTQLGREDSAIIADPLQQFGGSVNVRTDLQLWGMEANALFNIRRDAGFEWTFLTGARYLDLRESFTLNAVSRDLLFNQYITLADRFSTANQFLGYQFGSRMRWRYERLLFDATGKFAFGGIGHTRNISGLSSSTGPDASNPGSFAGGFYAQPSNMGRSTDVDFAIMPALELKLAYQIATGVVGSIGYDVFYLSRTARVVDQIDRNLNLSQSAVLGSATPAGPQSPNRTSETTGLIVQGFSLGLEFRY